MRRLILILIVCLSVIPTAAQDETSSDAPYIYWYNDYLNAFVIERADGTDSRIFGEGLMPSNTNNVDGPGWSPSGKWFAWTSSMVEAYSVSNSQAQILNVNGYDRVTVLDEWIDARLWWSPTEDSILVWGAVDENFQDSATGMLLIPKRIGLVNPNTNEIIAAVETNQPDFDGSGVTWIESGQQVIAYYMDYFTFYSGKAQNSYYIIQIFDIAGNVTEKRIYGDIVGRVSSKGTVAYIPSNRSTLIVENLLTGEQTEYREPALFQKQYSYIDTIIWDEEETFGLVISDINDPISLWLLDRENKTLKQLHPSASFRNSQISQNLWSPENKVVAFTDEQQALYLFDVASQTNTLIPIEPIGNWKWLDNTHLFLFVFGEHPFSGIYDVMTNEITKKVDGYNQAYFSPNQQYAVFIREHPVIVDFQTNEQINLRPHSIKHMTAMNDGEIFWHPESAWFITGEYSLVAGGGTGRLLRAVVKADGTLRRDFSACSPTQCANWLPAQVNVAELPPALLEPFFPEPEIVLKGTEHITLLSWSPDSKLLASGTGYYRHNQDWKTIWNIDTKTNEDFYTADERDVFIPRSETELATSPDGKQYVGPTTGGWEHMIHDAETRQPLQEIENGDYFESFSYSPDGQLIAGGGNSERIHFWGATSGRFLVQLPVYGKAVAFSPDGKWLAVGVSWDIHIYDMDKIRAWVAGSSQHQN